MAIFTINVNFSELGWRVVEEHVVVLVATWFSFGCCNEFILSGVEKRGNREEFR